MCLATPAKIIRLKDKNALVRDDHGERRVNLHLLSEKPKIGDYLLVHGDLAINRLGKKDALEILNLNKEISDCKCSKK